MTLAAILFDVDGVLVDSPHERAWRETLDELMRGDWRALRDRSSYAPARFSSALYQRLVAGKPREAGARAALEHFRVPDAAQLAGVYGAKKQEKLTQLIEAGESRPFPDAMRFLLAVKSGGARIAAASSSKNANDLLRRIHMDELAADLGLSFVHAGTTLLDLFDANVAGRDFPHGKPAPDIFLAAAAELGAEPAGCVVVEDAAVGVEAAKAGGMRAIGVARMQDQAALRSAGADLVVTSLDEVVVMPALMEGRLEQRRRAA